MDLKKLLDIMIEALVLKDRIKLIGFYVLIINLIKNYNYYYISFNL